MYSNSSITSGAEIKYNITIIAIAINAPQKYERAKLRTFTFCANNATAIKGVDFYNLNEMFYSLILPATMAINAPIFVLIEYSLAKLDFFQTL